VFPDPQIIINEKFEKAIMDAIKTVIGEDVKIQRCLFSSKKSKSYAVLNNFIGQIQSFVNFVAC